MLPIALIGQDMYFTDSDLLRLGQTHQALFFLSSYISGLYRCFRMYPANKKTICVIIDLSKEMLNQAYPNKHPPGT